MSHQWFASRTTFLHTAAKSILPILLLLGCASRDMAEPKAFFTDTQICSRGGLSPNEVASADCSGTQGLLAIDPVLGCYERVRTVQEVRNAKDALELSQVLFPDSKLPLRVSPLNSRLPTRAELQLSSALISCYMSCVETEVQVPIGENDAVNRLGLSRKHYAARLGVLKEFLTGAMSFGTYTSRIGMLDGQLHAGVFYSSNE